MQAAQRVFQALPEFETELKFQAFKYRINN